MHDKAHMTSLFENATEGILLSNGAGTIVMVNPAAERMFEYSSDELIVQPIEILIPDKYSILTKPSQVLRYLCWV